MVLKLNLSAKKTPAQNFKALKSANTPSQNGVFNNFAKRNLSPVKQNSATYTQPNQNQSAQTYGAEQDKQEDTKNVKKGNTPLIGATQNDKTEKKDEKQKETQKGESIFEKIEKSIKTGAEKLKLSADETEIALEALASEQAGSAGKLAAYSIGTNHAKTTEVTVQLGSYKGNTPNITIQTPFGEQLGNCIYTTQQLKFYQSERGANYGDQCLGMSAIFGAAIMGNSHYFDSQFGKVSGTDLSWSGDNLGPRTNINSCKDMSENFTQETFDNKDNLVSTVKTELSKGKPVIIEVSAISNGNDSRHYVTAIGTTEKGEIVVWDPYTADCRVLDLEKDFSDWKKSHNGDRVLRKDPTSGNKYQLYTWKDQSTTESKKA